MRGERAMGQIKLTGIAAHGHHGVFEHERRNGQRFVVDVTLELDLTAAVETDELSHTVDYGALAQAIVADITGEPLNLIEALAGRIAATCLADDRVAEVSVTVHKPQAPITVPFEDVAVTMHQKRRTTP
ncbi:dihydroneopterin aldolase [Enemella sp. A6]|uniref:dihydroneopterin aldolase n=1 Tax=Enemella sp. A6 TaxID=3440152 RepID=UPI003EBB5065